MREPLSYNMSTVPADSQYLVVWDSTWGLNLPASAAAEPAPGTYRGRWAGHRVRVTIKNGNQAVTVVFRALTDSTATTNAGFETDTSGPGGGSVTLAASDTGVYNWLPAAPDSRVYVLAGSNNPDAMKTSVLVTWHDLTSGT